MISSRSDVPLTAGAESRQRSFVDTSRLNIYRDPMNVELTPDQRALIRRAIETGRFRREEEAVHEALALKEERERSRLELVAALDEAKASRERGDGRTLSLDSLKAFGKEITRRGRWRIETERFSGR